MVLGLGLEVGVQVCLANIASAEYRILFIGDSITLHPPKASLQWTNFHGMAASAPEKDYVHLVLSDLRKAMPGTTIKELIPGGVGWVKGALTKLRELQGFHPNFVVVQLGEHELTDGRLPRLEKDYEGLLKGLLAFEGHPVVIGTGLWNPQTDDAPYAGEIEQVETTMAHVARDLGVFFVSVQDLARDPACYGYGKVRGVQWHPNDKGMQGYATRIVAAWSSRRAAALTTVSDIATNPIASSPGEGVPALPPIKPLFNYPVRDTCMCVGPDGTYYLTGTTGSPGWWKTNEGVRIWRSPDLKTWEPIGLVWSFAKNTTWQETFEFPGVTTPEKKQGRLALWAPELHYFKGTFWVAYCVVREAYNGTGILKSMTGRPEGPYVDIKPEGPLTRQIDASLFVDDDGKVYFVYQNGKIARMKDDMSGLAEEPRLLRTKEGGQVGFEGAFLFKANGRYHLLCADFTSDRQYHCMAASSEKLEGPYSSRYLAIPHGGHNMIFQDRDGQWWSTMFGNGGRAPIHEKPVILRIEIDKDGRIKPLVALK
jgi:xylan 1,4-beta-xylosidase